MNPSTSPPANPARKPGWLSHPLLSLLLGASWLALSHSLEPVHLLSALLIALIVPRLLHPFLGEHSSIHWGAAVRLTAVVLKDIVLANITVARLVLGPLPRMQPAWLPVPLACDHPRVNALFATIITTTPGTVSCVVDEQRHLNSGACPDLRRRAGHDRRHEDALRSAFAPDISPAAARRSARRWRHHREGRMNALDIALNMGVAAVTVAVVLCAWRLLRGPEMTDRLLALDTLYMNAVALIVLLGIRWNTALLFEAALLVAMLGFASTVALARYLSRGDVVE
jgi:multicomponent K+:H+ antiporter subunit E